MPKNSHVCQKRKILTAKTDVFDAKQQTWQIFVRTPKMVEIGLCISSFLYHNIFYRFPMVGVGLEGMGDSPGNEKKNLPSQIWCTSFHHNHCKHEFFKF